jgi:DNA-binding NarL/FixJ family response regulator
VDCAVLALTTQPGDQVLRIARTGLTLVEIAGFSLNALMRKSCIVCRPASWITSMVRILIADDHEVVRSGLRQILEAQPNWQVVAEAGDGKVAVAKAIETKPDVCVLDYSLPLMNGLEVTRQIRLRMLQSEVLIFTMHDSETLVHDLLQAGARGYLLKSDAKAHLIDAISSLASHRPFFTAKVSEALVDAYLARSTKQASAITSRERSVLQLIAEGHTNKEIAGILNISLKTVETHRASMMRKLQVTSSAGLVRYAIRNKIVEP